MRAQTPVIRVPLLTIHELPNIYIIPKHLSSILTLHFRIKRQLSTLSQLIISFEILCITLI